jgi:hypothetical protein
MPSIGQIIASALLILLGGYIIHRSISLRKVQKKLSQAVGSAEVQIKRMEEAISVSRENIQVAKENRDAVRELTAAIRQLLEKQNQGNS